MSSTPGITCPKCRGGLLESVQCESSSVVLCKDADTRLESRGPAVVEQLTFSGYHCFAKRRVILTRQLNKRALLAALQPPPTERTPYAGFDEHCEVDPAVIDASQARAEARVAAWRTLVSCAISAGQIEPAEAAALLARI